MEETEITCMQCALSDNCPCGHSYNNAACLTLRKRKQKNGNHPCSQCRIRKMFARALDMHFWGEDCPYECEQYERWKTAGDQREKGEAHE